MFIWNQNQEVSIIGDAENRGGPSFFTAIMPFVKNEGPCSFK
jgi:hypothetical protein